MVVVVVVVVVVRRGMVVVEAVKLRKTRFRKSRQAAAAEDVIERQIVPRLDTQPQCYYYGVLLLSHHRILATPSSFLCKLWLHVSTTTGKCIGMIALGCIACFFVSHY